MNRFWSKVDKSGDCWEWKAAKDSAGYGKFKMNGAMGLAHRAALMLSGVDIPDGMCVMHRCDNRGCVNPDHLALGTHQENMADMVAKGRGHMGYKLTESDVSAIRELRIPQADIARMFGIRQPHVSRIKNRVRYAFPVGGAI